MHDLTFQAFACLDAKLGESGYMDRVNAAKRGAAWQSRPTTRREARAAALFALELRHGHASSKDAALKRRKVKPMARHGGRGVIVPL